MHDSTDVSLLWDATRVAVREGSRLAGKHGLPHWRQSAYQLRKGKSLFNRISHQRQWSKRPKEVAAYVQWSEAMTSSMGVSLANLPSNASQEKCDLVALMSTKATIWQDQVRRRLLQGEVIPHEEKLFSVFEEHTRWVRAELEIALGRR